MGYGTHLFISPVDPNLICGICSAVLEDAVLTPCGHSFCHQCLNTWLAKPGISSCPECRSLLASGEAKPVLCLRNLIKGFDVECSNNERGCKVIVKLERLNSHLETCSHAPVTCAGCNQTVNRADLAEHQMDCEGIAAAVDEDDETFARKRLGSIRKDYTITSAEVSDLLGRISSLEFQLKNMKRDLQIAESKNRVLEREYRKTKDELQQREMRFWTCSTPSLTLITTTDTRRRVSQNCRCLSQRFLLNKPSYIDSDKIFAAVKRSYDQYARCGSEFEHDVHMLVATAFASNWFGQSHRINFHCWLTKYSSS
ncbi:hypothetical protein FSP39_020125 [Pinctada imbricata]|uniref:RING-type domain-containing protein n=1 Tax=Pinctada imbricata TaxID=66713 RepID=A0AA88Y6F0_PINIB|nr:hypothetical protein FSP39_020125 [Pinctada imbricata]